MPQPPHKVMADRLRDMGNRSLSKGNIDEAIEDFKRAVAVAPEYAYLHWSLIDAYIKNRQYDEGLSVYAKARQDCQKDVEGLGVDPDEFFDRWWREFQEQIKTRITLDQYRIYVMETVVSEPGLLQSQLKTDFSGCEPNLMGLAVWELEKERKLVKIKKGRSFQLYITP